MTRFLKEKYIRWVGILLVSFIVMFTGPEDHLRDEPLWKHYLISLVFTTVYWNGAFLIFIGFRRMFPGIGQTVKRLTVTYIVLFIWMSAGGIPVKLAFGFMDIHDIWDPDTYLKFLVMNLTIAVIVGTIYETVFFFERWKDAIRQNEELKNQQIRTQFEVLQNQMSPHFLFNSLNTLTTLIAEDQSVAMSYTQKLSDVYRYILKNKERELVPLAEEVEFVKDYIFLLEMRYPENLVTNFAVGKSYLDLYIAPLTLQILVENAIKHNVISKASPLYIDIYIEMGDKIMVKNNLQKKSVLEKSTKTGLDNIKRRYKYFGDNEIDVIITQKNFIVAVPLIHVSGQSVEPRGLDVLDNQRRVS